MATVSTKTATPVMPPSFTMSQDISRAIMTASTQKAEKNRSTLIDGMPPAPPPSPVTFKSKSSYDDIPSLSSIPHGILIIGSRDHLRKPC
ncbi:unnamed protein product [Penicillium bialowiezense]